MMRKLTSQRARTGGWTELARAVWGGALLIRPRAVLGRVHSVEIDARSIVVARALGARHLVQAVMSRLRPRPDVLAIAAAWSSAGMRDLLRGAATAPHEHRGGTSARVCGGHAAGERALLIPSRAGRRRCDGGEPS